MVIISDGYSEDVAYECRKTGIFGEKIQFVTSLDLIKCLKQNK